MRHKFSLIIIFTLFLSWITCCVLILKIMKNYIVLDYVLWTHLICSCTSVFHTIFVGLRLSFVFTIFHSRLGSPMFCSQLGTPFWILLCSSKHLSFPDLGSTLFLFSFHLSFILFYLYATPMLYDTQLRCTNTVRTSSSFLPPPSSGVK